MTIQNLKSAGGIISIMTLLYFVLTKYFGFLNIDNKSSLGWLLFSSLWAIVILLVLYSKFVEKNKFLLWGEAKIKLSSCIISILGLYAIVVLLGIIKNKLGVIESNAKIASDQKFWSENFALFIYMGLTAGFAEELLFRGYILTRLELITKSKWLSIIISSVLFSIAHFTNSDISKMFFLFGFGLVFSIHYFKYRNILALGITHVLTDILSF